MSSAVPGRPIAFRIEHNGEHVCLAGLQGRAGVVSLIVHSALRQDTQELVLDVGGLDSGSADHLTWDRRQLCIGDEIRLVVEENANPTLPKERIPVGGATESELELEAIRQAAEKLGYKLVKRAARRCSG